MTFCEGLSILPFFDDIRRFSYLTHFPFQRLLVLDRQLNTEDVFALLEQVGLRLRRKLLVAELLFETFHRAAHVLLLDMLLLFILAVRHLSFMRGYLSDCGLQLPRIVQNILILVEQMDSVVVQFHLLLDAFLVPFPVDHCQYLPVEFFFGECSFWLSVWLFMLFAIGVLMHRFGNGHLLH